MAWSSIIIFLGQLVVKVYFFCGYSQFLLHAHMCLTLPHPWRGVIFVVGGGYKGNVRKSNT